MNRKHGPCMLCGETIGRAATEQVQICFCNVWLWVCGPCARVERAETELLMAQAALAEDDEEVDGDA